jgi:hypothetical protein
VGDHVGIPAAVCFAFILAYHQSHLLLPVQTLLLLGVRYTMLVVDAVLTQKHICLFLVQGHIEHFSRSIPIYRRQHRLFLPVAKYFSTLLSDH